MAGAKEYYGPIVTEWFAWRPVRTGALGTGRWVWLERVRRSRCLGVTIYQPLDKSNEKVT
jgi:hypothetical protein